jgi:23S rRNA U2552 (ribose-2'-O)-methylase RlmE/FtsJ
MPPLHSQLGGKLVNRASHKLAEACEQPGLRGYLQQGMSALDVGAAPGGWSSYLALQGLDRVVAIDPAEMTPEVRTIFYSSSSFSLFALRLRPR